MMAARVGWDSPADWSFSLILVLIYIASIPFGLSIAAGPLNLLRVTIAAAVIGVAIIRITAGASPWRSHPSALWLAVLAMPYLVSMMTARDPAIALQAGFSAGLGALLAMTVHTVCPTAARWRIALTALTAIGAVAGLYALATAGSVQAQFSGASALFGRPVGIFTDPNQLGTFSAVLLMLAWAQVLGAKTTPERLLAAGCALVSGANLMMSFSRGAWLGAALGACLLLFVTIRLHFKAVVTGAAIAATVGIPVLLVIVPSTVQLIAERVLSIFDPTSNPNDNRIFIYREAYDQILQRPLFGQGPGNFTQASYLAGKSIGSVNAEHSHNLILQISSETGLLSLAAFAIFVLSLARRTWRAWKELAESEAMLLLGLVAALLAVFGQGMVDFTLGNPILFYLVWTIIGVLFAATHRSRSQPRSVLNEGVFQ